VVTSLSVVGLAERGWQVVIAAPRYPDTVRDAFPPEAMRAGTTDVLLLPSAPLPFYPDIRLSLPNRTALARLAARHRPHLVHCATEFSLGWLGQSVARERRIPIVTSYHTDFSRYTEAYGVAWLRPAVARHLGRFHQRAVRTYTPSAPAANDVRALGARDVQVWGRGVDTALFHPRQRSEALRAAYGRRDAFLFLHVGRLAAEKGVEHIVRAYALARARLPEGAVHLVIAGAGPRADALRAMGTDGITFLGNLDRRDVLPRLYASADAFLFSSVTETLGLVVLEAMSSGLPVVATPAGGVADHLRHEANGLAYPAHDADAMADAMVALVLDRARTASLARGARATAEALDWRLELDRLDASYRDVITSA
jgi:glycosyltransferase involved in cell wall biosynthesis